MSDTEYTKGYKAGMLFRQGEIAKLVANRICFDHKAGSCEHQSCFALAELAGLIEGKSA